VERVVVTSSVAAIAGAARPGGGPLSEDDWTDPDKPGLSPYVRSKTIAERAAWDFVDEAGASERLAVVNPGAILGPTLSDDHSFSLQAVERLLGGMPGIPRIGFSFVDVRDVADLQLRAMTAPAAGGERFVAAGPFLWASEVAAVLRDGLGEAASKVPKRSLPDWLVRIAARFDPGIRSITNQLGVRLEYTSAKSESRLGWQPRPAEEMILDTGRSLTAA
jgi:nucleoside-diphosphate-sugar epimerase